MPGRCSGQPGDPGLERGHDRVGHGGGGRGGRLRGECRRQDKSDHQGVQALHGGYLHLRVGGSYPSKKVVPGWDYRNAAGDCAGPYGHSAIQYGDFSSCDGVYAVDDGVSAARNTPFAALRSLCGAHRRCFRAFRPFRYPHNPHSNPRGHRMRLPGIATHQGAHPGSGIVVDRLDQAYFIGMVSGIWKLDLKGGRSHPPGQAFYWIALDAEGHLAGGRGPPPLDLFGQNGNVYSKM